MCQPEKLDWQIPIAATATQLLLCTILFGRRRQKDAQKALLCIDEMCGIFIGLLPFSHMPRIVYFFTFLQRFESFKQG